MKKVFFILFTVAFSVATFGQTVNLSGSWKINDSKSKLNEQFSFSPKVVTITQSDNELIVEKKVEFQGQESIMTEKYTLDGKECSNPGFMETVKKSTATVSDDKKSIKVSSKVALGDGGEVVTEETYSLDGNNLNYVTNTNSSFGDSSETAVYDKI